MAYEAERSVPTLDQCSANGASASLLFDGFYLKFLINGAVDCAWHARSGIPDGDGMFIYTPEQQALADVGPVPAGKYWILPSQIAKVSWGNSSWGNYRITIHYLPLTDTKNRGGFFIHGGDKFGSRGCIDLAQYIDSFIAKINLLYFGREEVPETEGGGMKPGYTSCHLPLTVQYGAPKVAMP